MKKSSIIILLLLPLMVIVAQTSKPDWCDPDSRRFLYPDAEYFVGFESGFARQGESIADATDRIKTQAQGDAAQRIQVHVQSSLVDNVQSIQRQTARGFDEEIQTLFSKQTSTHTSIEIPNLQSMTWNNLQTGEVAVLVYTRRRDFVRFYDRQIESLLGKMESGIENAVQQEQQGQQIKGRTTAEKTLKLCPEVEYAQRMMALGDANATMNDLQMPRYTALVKKLIEAINRMRHATSFYITCKATINEKNYPMLEREVRGKLSEKGCHFTNDTETVDWLIDIDAEVINTAHMEGMPYFAYVDGTLKVQNGKTQQNVAEDRLSNLERGHYDGIKGGDFSAERAARIAYSDAARIIAEYILKLIQE